MTVTADSTYTADSDVVTADGWLLLITADSTRTADSNTVTADGSSTSAPSPVEDVRVGGDDAFHENKHQGWSRKAWKKRKQAEDALEETIRREYLKSIGIDPDPVVVREIIQEAREETQEEVASFTPDYSGVVQWLALQQQVVNEIIRKRQEEIDEEEALLLLL